jgi:hypothetical protein
MAPPASRPKKPSGKATIQEPSQSPPFQREHTEPPLSVDNSTLDPPADLTPETVSQTLLRPEMTVESEVDLRTQINQSLSNNLGTTVSLTEEQFRGLLNQFSVAGPNQPVPTTEVPLNLHKKRRGTPGILIGQTGRPDDDPSDDPSDGSFRSSYRPRNRPQRRTDRHETPARTERRSPKHNDPPELDDGTSPSYNAWRALLQGKLTNNADWWATERERVNYVFSKTTGKAQRYLEPRIDEECADPWLSVDEMLQYLDTVFRNYFEAQQAEDEFVVLEQTPGQEFSDFYTEFARLVSVGRIAPSI